MNRSIIIGLDGVPFRLLQDLAGRGVMPNCATIIDSGFFAPISSTIPEISSVAWSSIITGKNPAEHGIFGFMDIPRGTYRISFPNFNSLQAKPFWHTRSERSVIVNVPATFPVKPMNGVHVSGFVSLDFERSVYPDTLIPTLRDYDYRVDVEAEKAHLSMDLFLDDLDKTLTARAKAAQFLWNDQEWETFMLVFTGTDRLMHFLWDAYEDPKSKYHAKFIDHFRKVDKVIGSLMEQTKDEDSVVFLSDHGMERLEANVYINHILRENGFISVSAENGRFTETDEKTRAFSLDPARIYLNKRGKYPRGAVGKGDEKKVCDDLVSLFDSVEIDGKKICKSIYRKEEIFYGPLLDDAPDLVFVGNSGFNLHSSLKAKTLSDTNVFTGKHTQHDAFLLVKDCPNTYRFEKPLCVSNLIYFIEELKIKRCLI